MSLTAPSHWIGIMVFASSLRRSFAVFLACAVLVVAPLARGADEEADALAHPGQALTPQILFDMLLAEIALARGRLDYTLPLYERLANQTQDARVARRATEIAIYARRADMAQSMARIWAHADPASEDAQRVLTGTFAGGDMPTETIEMRLAETLAKAGPRLPGALLGLNRVLAPIQDKDRVRKIIGRVTEPYLELAEAHFARAHAASAARDLPGSLAALEAALAIRPDWSQAVLLKAQIEQTEKPDLAVHTLGTYLQRYPDDVDVRRGYGRALLGVKRYPEARQAFEAVILSEPEDLSSRYAVAIIALETGDLEAAQVHLDALSAAGYADGDGLATAKAQVAEARGDLPAAIGHYDAVEKAPRRERAQLRAAQLLAREGQLEAARARLRALGTDDESRANYLLIEAQLLREADQPVEAMRVIDEGLRVQPDNPDLLYESAMLAEKLDRIEAMEGRLRKIIALNPDYAHAYNALGYSLADRGERLEEAEALIRKAVELRPQDPFIMDSLGWVRYRRGDLSTARDILQRAYSLRPDPEIAAHLGEVMWEMGDQEAARKTWQDAARDNPENATLTAVMRRYGQ
jgi:tetratricopeptide (TPR) repeat protein